MKKSGYFYVLLLLTLVLGAGCSGEDEEETPTPEQVTYKCRLIKEQVSYPTPGQSYTRDFSFTNGLLTGVIEQTNLAQSSTSRFTFVYDGQGRVMTTNLVDAQGGINQFYAFEYDASGLVTKVYWFNKFMNPGAAAPALYSVRDFTYNAAKQLTRSKHWLITGPTPLILNDYTFTYDAKGNVTQVNEYRVFGYQGENFTDINLKLSFTYDDKINPYHDNTYMNALPPGLLILNLSPNNVLTTKSESTVIGTVKGPGPTFDASIYNYTRSNTYTYTPENRPATLTTSQGNVRTFSYTCEK